MSKERCVVVSALCVLLFAPVGSTKPQERVLVWSDEFDGPAKSSPDSTRWTFETGGGGWGNNELEYYTSRLQNAFIDGEGKLVIKALRENYTGPGYSGGTPLTGIYTLPDGQHFSDAFHVFTNFTIEWEPTAIRFYVDGNLYQTRTPADVPAGSRWVFDHPFFILLNVAVGGNWPGSPDATTT